MRYLVTYRRGDPPNLDRRPASQQTEMVEADNAAAATAIIRDRLGVGQVDNRLEVLDVRPADQDQRGSPTSGG